MNYQFIKNAINDKSIQTSVVPAGYDAVVIYDTELMGFGVQKTQAGELTYFFCLFSETGRILRKWEIESKEGELTAQSARERAIEMSKQLQKCKACPVVDSCGVFIPATEPMTIYFY